jgi:hypothetical protein
VGHAHLRQVDKYSTKNNRLALSGSNVISWRRERECGDVYLEGDEAMRAVFIFFLPFLRLYVWVNFVGVAAQLHRLYVWVNFVGVAAQLHRRGGRLHLGSTASPSPANPVSYKPHCKH